MTPAARRVWIDCAQDALSLATDYAASFVADADHAGANLHIRLAALRGQVRGLAAADLPYDVRDGGRLFLSLARTFSGEGVIPARRLAAVDRLKAAATQMAAALAHPPTRPRADLDG